MSNMCSIFANICGYLRIFAKICENMRAPWKYATMCAARFAHIFGKSTCGVKCDWRQLNEIMCKMRGAHLGHNLTYVWNMFNIRPGPRFFPLLRNCTQLFAQFEKIRKRVLHIFEYFRNLRHTCSHIFVICKMRGAHFGHILKYVWNVFNIRDYSHLFAIIRNYTQLFAQLEKTCENCASQLCGSSPQNPVFPLPLRARPRANLYHVPAHTSDTQPQAWTWLACLAMLGYITPCISI